MAPDWPQPPPRTRSMHRVEVDGRPALRLDLTMRGADGGNEGLLATAMRLVNAIPAVVAAPAGMASVLDLRLGVGRRLLSRDRPGERQ
jgi:hypothetical protein